MIGLTFDLREHYLALGYGEEETAEFDRPETIDALEAAIRAQGNELGGHEVERIGTVRQLAAALVDGRRWDLVFNICEGLSGVAREAQVPALLDAWHIPYCFSDPLVMALTLDKAMAKRVVAHEGVPTAGFALVETMSDLVRIDLPFPLFCKPYAEGTGKGIGPMSRVEDKAALARTCEMLLARFRQPVLVETYLPGREFTVGIVGSGHEATSIGVMEIALAEDAEAGAYGYVNKEECERRIHYRRADDAEALAAAQVALDAWRVLGCRDGGRVDIKSDGAGKPHFLEVNPLAGLHPEHSDLPILASLHGIDYGSLIGRILASAIGRHGLARSAIAAE
ncbi:MAG: D-alanine--D-alanine ligase [Dongiaceae bacterium]